MEGDPPCLTGLLEAGHELAATIDLDRLDGKRKALHEIIEKGDCRASGGSGADPEDRLATDDIDGGELASLYAGERAQMDGIELDQCAGVGRGSFVRRNPGGIGTGCSAMAYRHPARFDQQEPSFEAGQDTPDRRFGEGYRLGQQEIPQLGFAPARMRQPSGQDRRLHRRTPLLPASPVRSPGALFQTAQIVRIESLQPAIDGGAGDAEERHCCRNAAPGRALDRGQASECLLTRIMHPR